MIFVIVINSLVWYVLYLLCENAHVKVVNNIK